MNEEELNKLAAAELLKEAERGRQRAVTLGATGWNKPRVHAVNKQFLRRTIASTLPTKVRPKKVDNNKQEENKLKSKKRKRSKDDRERKPKKKKKSKDKKQSTSKLGDKIP